MSDFHSSVVIDMIAPRRPKILQVVLVVILALFGIAGTVRMLRPQMDERLYARFRNLPQANFDPLFASCSDQDSIQLENCSRLFNKKNYTQALAALQQLPPDVQKQAEVQFFTALCYLERNQMKEAEALLRPLSIQQNQSGLEANWYVALSNLRRHKRTEAAQILLNMSPQAVRFQEAQQLLHKLGY